MPCYPELETICGILEDYEDITASVEEVEELLCSLQDTETIIGLVEEIEDLECTFNEVEDLFAVIDEVCVTTVSQLSPVDCLVTDEVGKWVYITGPEVNNRYQVATADAFDTTKIPAFGILVSKTSDTQGFVQWLGQNNSLSGLLTGPGYRVLYLGANGDTLQQPPGGGAYVQPLGTVVDDEEILIEPDWTQLPLPAYASHYNTNDGTATCLVDDTSTSSRFVSNPSGHFDIGDWVAGTVHPTTRTSPISYSTPNPFSVLNDVDTVFTVTVYGANGTTILAQQTVTLTGDAVQSGSGITITISGFSADLNKFKASATVEFDLATILPTGGRFSIEIEHDNGSDGVFTKLQSDIFYDNETNAAILAGVALAEGTPVTRFLTGVEYYDIGSTFKLNISDIDDLNDESYPQVQVEADGSDYGLPDLDLEGGDLTGWTNDWDNDNSSYFNAAWAITQIDLTLKTLAAQVFARVLDWVAGSWIGSVVQAILIETHDDTNSRTTERYYFEDWRCALTADFDNPNAKLWDSTIDKNPDDALFYDGGVEHNSDDWTSYNPNPSGQPDYTAHTGRQYLVREFKHSGLASSSFQLSLSGTFSSLEYKLAKAWDGTPSGGTTWVNALVAYNASQWNNGNPIGGSGGQLTPGEYSLGTNNIVNTGDTIYVMVGLDPGDRIEGPTTIIFD